MTTKPEIRDEDLKKILFTLTLVKNRLNTEFDGDLVKECVTASMEYLEKYFFGLTVSEMMKE